MGRANTAGDAIVWLPRQRIVITGDVVTAPIPYGFNTYPREWLSVLQKIRDLHFSTLIPGHGLPRHNVEYIDELSAALNDVRTQVAPWTSSKLDAASVSEKVNLNAFRDHIVGDDPWLQRWFKSYWKDPIVSSSLREALGEPIVQGSG
jgi:glyoxylase-like metal-dependent hydrolase (beta-lactamase superfamily II)